jgi:hypothetical protein
VERAGVRQAGAEARDVADIPAHLNIYTQVIDGSVRRAADVVGAELFAIVQKSPTVTCLLIVTCTDAWNGTLCEVRADERWIEQVLNSAKRAGGVPHSRRPWNHGRIDPAASEGLRIDAHPLTKGIG